MTTLAGSVPNFLLMGFKYSSVHLNARCHKHHLKTFVRAPRFSIWGHGSERSSISLKISGWANHPLGKHISPLISIPLPENDHVAFTENLQHSLKPPTLVNLTWHVGEGPDLQSRGTCRERIFGDVLSVMRLNTAYTAVDAWGCCEEGGVQEVGERGSEQAADPTKCLICKTLRASVDKCWFVPTVIVCNCH